MMYPFAHLVRSGMGPLRTLAPPRGITAVMVGRIHGPLPPFEYPAAPDWSEPASPSGNALMARPTSPPATAPAAASAAAPHLLCDEAGQLYAWARGSLTPLNPLELQQTWPAGRDAGFRPLLPEPGRSLVVRWGDFRPLLFSQIAHPERLRENHRVAVQLQVYEVTRPQRLDDLAESLLGDRSRGGELAVMTDALAAHLALSGPLPPRAPGRLERLRQAPHVLAGHERVFRLTLASDPTGEAPSLPAAEDPRAAGSAPAVPPPRRESVPEAYARPWEFRRSREEVLYDMAAGRSLGGWLRSALSRFGVSFSRRQDFQRWQLLLSGKPLDEQLWAVRPPRGGLGDRLVREWAQHTLERAGYDPRTMTLEWEIYWRRKGE